MIQSKNDWIKQRTESLNITNCHQFWKRYKKVFGVNRAPCHVSVRRVSPGLKKELHLIFNQCHFFFRRRFFGHIFVLFGHIFVTFLSHFGHIPAISIFLGTFPPFYMSHFHSIWSHFCHIFTIFAQSLCHIFTIFWSHFCHIFTIFAQSLVTFSLFFGHIFVTFSLFLSHFRHNFLICHIFTVWAILLKSDQ